MSNGLNDVSIWFLVLSVLSFGMRLELPDLLS